MAIFSTTTVGIPKRGFFELEFFRPNAKHLIPSRYMGSPVVFLAFWMFIMPLALLPIFSVLPFLINNIFFNKYFDRVRLHKMQVRYLETGLIPPQIGSFRHDEKRLWDNEEKRHRYRDNNWK